jgi:hypothetical protein
MGGCKSPVLSKPDTNPGNSFIQFENKSNFPVHIYSSSYSRDDNGTPFASAGANGTSAVAYPAGTAEFYITYLLGFDGFAIPYAPPGEAGYVYGRVAANQTTAIPIPPLSDKLNGQQMASPVTNEVYVNIQNASYSALEFHQGTSPLNTQEDVQKTVNALETRTYLIQSGSAALYSFKRNGVTALNFPAGMTQFEAGHLYSFLYERNDSVTLRSDKVLSVVEAGALSVGAGLYDNALDVVHKIGSQDLTSALSYISTNAQTGHNYFIVLEADEIVSDGTLSYPGKTVDITLMGNGAERTINLGTNSTLLVGYGVTLTLGDNITLSGRSSNTPGLVSVGSGTLVMNDGSKITGNTSSSSGVYIVSVYKLNFINTAPVITLTL